MIQSTAETQTNYPNENTTPGQDKFSSPFRHNSLIRVLTLAFGLGLGLVLSQAVSLFQLSRQSITSLSPTPTPSPTQTIDTPDQRKMYEILANHPDLEQLLDGYTFQAVFESMLHNVVVLGATDEQYLVSDTNQESVFPNRIFVASESYWTELFDSSVNIECRPWRFEESPKFLALQTTNCPDNLHFIEASTGTGVNITDPDQLLPNFIRTSYSGTPEYLFTSENKELWEISFSSPDLMAKVFVDVRSGTVVDVIDFSSF